MANAESPVRQWALILSLLLSTCLGLSAVAALLVLVAGGHSVTGYALVGVGGAFASPCTSFASCVVSSRSD
jgi:hypothetical protein